MSPLPGRRLGLRAAAEAAALAAASAHLSAADPVLAQLIRRHGPCTLRRERTGTPYTSLARAIVHQQLHGRAASAIHARLTALGPHGRFPEPAQLLALSAGQLRAAGLSATKQAALRDLAAQTLAGVVPTLRQIHRLGDAAILERCTQVRGIGRWTVEMMLIFRLGRPDVLPVDDYGVRQGYRRAYGHDLPPAPAALRQHGVAWSPYRSVAAWYLWRAADERAAALDAAGPPITLPRVRSAR
jgi:DNA-3-methyladenine glycosylase II